MRAGSMRDWTVALVCGVALWLTPGAAGQTDEVVTEPPRTSDRHLRALLYSNVRHPGGTYSTRPLTESQNLDKPLPAAEGGSEAPALQFLGVEQFDGFEVHAVNDAALLLTGLTDSQRTHVQVVRAGEVGNTHDLVVVEDELGVDLYVYFQDGWAGAGRPYYQPLGTYYSPCFHGLGCTVAWCTGGVGLGWGPHSNLYGWYSPDDWGGWSGNVQFLRRYDYRRYWGPLESSYSPQFPEPPAGEGAPALERVELTPVVLGLTLLKTGHAPEAADMFRAQLREDPDDAVALRLMGAALVEVGDVSEGIATIRLAYGLDPALAGVPIDRSLFGSGLRLRQMVRKVVRVANDENSSSAWLAVVVFMQAEGRDAVALKNLAKAEREYLSEDIARALRRELE